MGPELGITLYPKGQKGCLKSSAEDRYLERLVKALLLLTVLKKQQQLPMRNKCEKCFLYVMPI